MIASHRAASYRKPILSGIRTTPRRSQLGRVIAMATAATNSPSPTTPGSAAPGVQPPAYAPRYIDIGINLADPIFRGRYHGKQRHPDDLQAVVQRARDVGCTKFIVTGSSFKSSRNALQLAQEFPGTVYTTAGIHPCSSAIFTSSHPHHHEADDDEHIAACDPDPSKPIPEDDPDHIDHARTDQIIADLRRLVTEARSNRAPAPALVALGEFGLDYDRLHYCSKGAQLHSFRAQLALAASLTPHLPLFLHSRACHADFVRLMRDAFGDKLERLERGGVVHSFTGSADEARELMDLGLYIGINGCSFKTADNCAVVREVRLDRLMIETDGPWCEVRPTHEGWRYLVEKKPETPESASNGSATADGEPTPPAEGKPASKKQSKKPQKKEPEVPERFKSVKKEKWVEGAMVKGRNEPCSIERIAKIVAGIKGVSVEEVCEAAWANTIRVFGLEQ